MSQGLALACLLLLTQLTACDALSKKGSGAGDGKTDGLPPGAVAVASGASSVSLPVVQPPASALAAGGLPSLAPLVKAAQPSVVTVRAWIKTQNAFGRELRQPQGVGTGFVYDTKGYLLTNNHVIEGAAELVVKLEDGRELEATVVGSDKPTDVAVLKVDAEGLPALPLGDSRALQVGDWVVAIGNPFGLEHTVSAGILSGKGRTRDDVQGLDPTGYFNFLQTDASINPGNSGGPLLNLAGQAVGINAAVRANANNIGFAIPMEMVVQLLPALLRDGKVRRSALGIYVDPVTAADAERLGGERKGARVVRVLPGKAADRAGLAASDIIVTFDGKPVADPNELRWLASIAGVGKPVVVRVNRGDRTFDLKVTLTDLDE